MGAVNCVVHRSGRLIGENTDGKGFLLSLPNSPKGKNVVILGAGGAARAIAVELALAGAGRIAIVNRDRARGQALADLLVGDVSRAIGRPVRAEFVPWVGDYPVPTGTHLLVNATSIGLYPDVDARIPIDESRLERGYIGCRRYSQSTGDASHPRRQSGRLRGSRRPRHAGDAGHNRG